MATVNLFSSIPSSTVSFSGAELKLYRCPSTSSSFPLCGQLGFPQVFRASLGNGGSFFFSTRPVACSQKRFDVRRHAKFQQFSPSDGPMGACEKMTDEEEPAEESTVDVPEDERADRVLPDSLEGAVLQSSESAALFVQSGGDRAIAVGRAVLEEGLPHGKLFSRYIKMRVELLLPDLINSGEEGDQLKLWNLSRLFLEDLQSRLGTQQMKAIFPDAGVAAMCQYQWAGATFKFASLNDRKPVNKDDEVVVLVQPDYQMLSSVEKIASMLADVDDGPPRSLIMYNPALQSGEVGIGLNVRRMREFFLSTFNRVYSMRSLSFGAIFRRYPGVWQVFFDDEKVPGRYVLAKEEVTCPDLEDVEMMFLARGNGTGDGKGDDKEPGPLQNLVGVLSSMSRFMQSLSR